MLQVYTYIEHDHCVILPNHLELKRTDNFIIDHSRNRDLYLLFKVQLYEISYLLPASLSRTMIIIDEGHQNEQSECIFAKILMKKISSIRYEINEKHEMSEY